jgi:hypothetical protein
MVQKLYNSYAWLHRRYIHEHKSIEEMAAEAKVVPMTIRRALDKAGLIRR